MPRKSDLDVLSGLSDASFRGIVFHVSGMSLEISHDQAKHLYPYRDGGVIEAMGRNPVMHSFPAFFRNGLSGWTKTPYPTVWREFLAAFADGSTGELMHPELGKLRVKPVSCKTTWESGKRDGADCDVQFIESNDLESDLLAALDAPGLVPFSAARDLDAACADVSPKPELPSNLSPSLLESLKKISGAIQMAKLGVGNVISQINGYASAVGELRDTIADADNPANYQAIAAAEQLFRSMLDLAETVAKKARPVTLKVVASDAELASVASSFGNSLDDFLKLNPALASRTRIAGGTTVLTYVV